MSPALLIAIGTACFLISCYLLVLARWLRKRNEPVAPVINCDNCRQGLAELSHTSVTGAWCCPVCGHFWSVVDGQPGVSESYDQA